MKEKTLIVTAKVIGTVFHPHIIPIVGMTLLYTCSYLSLLPWNIKLVTLLTVYAYTYFVPTTLTRLYRLYNEWSLSEIGHRERRLIPYAISIVSYLFCFYHMSMFRTPHVAGTIVVASLVIMVTCSLVNQWWKVSTHVAAMGGATGALMAYAITFDFNPTWWLCLLIAAAGLVATSRVVLRLHTVAQVVAGFAIGLVGALVAIFWF